MFKRRSRHLFLHQCDYAKAGPLWLVETVNHVLLVNIHNTYVLYATGTLFEKFENRVRLARAGGMYFFWGVRNERDGDVMVPYPQVV